jgi:hypothetical protein
MHNCKPAAATALAVALVAVSFAAQAADKDKKPKGAASDVKPHIAKFVTPCVKQKCLPLMSKVNECRRGVLGEHATSKRADAEKHVIEKKAELEKCVEPFSACSKTCSEAALAKAAKKGKTASRKGGGGEDEGGEGGGGGGEDAPKCSQEGIVTNKDRSLERCDWQAMCYWNCTFDDEDKAWKCVCM